jgi:glutathione S-transferase
MKLYGTPLSHFTRKTRILLDLYHVPYQFHDVGNVAEGTLETYAGNPLLKVPVLVDDTRWLIESDHIANYIVQKVDPTDRYGVGTHDLETLNMRAVLNGMMIEEVKFILARRTGVPVETYSFFEDARETVANGLQWLEQNAHWFNAKNPGYKEFHLVCAWEHLAYYELLAMPQVQLKNIVKKVCENETIRRTSPFLLKPKA